jgi:hypothetical protein
MSGIIERRDEVVPASGVVKFSGGNFLRMISATANTELRLVRDGTSERISGLTSVIARRIKPWDFGELRAVAGTVLVFFFGSGDFD